MYKSLVFSRINYCDALLAGGSKATLNKMQVVQNSAARILTRSEIRSDHRFCMVWLLNICQSSELSMRDLRSSQTGRLTVPSTRLRSMGDRAFSSLWNSLATEIKQAKSLISLKSHLKTHFFREDFTWIFGNTLF